MGRSRFAGQVALITGASSGIGAALARVVAAEGASLVLCARRIDRLDALSQELRSLGTDVLTCACDVTRPADLELVVAAAERHFGHLDVAIANAGFGVVGNVETLSIDDFRRQFDTNVFGVLATVYATLPALRRSRGCLAIVGSVAGYAALPGAAPYAMSKFAVRALAESLYGELHPHGVAVTLISSGFVASDIRKVDNRGRLHESARERMPPWLLMSAPAAARKMVNAIGRRQREVIVTGHGRLIVLAKRFFPGLVAAFIRRGVRGRAEPH